MQKTYWWRILIFVICGLGLSVGYITFYPYKFALCSYSQSGCAFSALKKTFSEPLFLFSISMVITSLFLFFISDKVFIKWLKFAVGWIILTIILVAVTPEYSGGWISLNPTKELVSIWMGALFVILSVGKIVWDSKRSETPEPF